MIYNPAIPSLTLIGITYGQNVLERILALQIFNISEFAGSKEKMPTAKIAETAKMIAYKYGYLKISELMQFCLNFKLGQYGNFYGVVDPMVILQALTVYETERRKAYDAYMQKFERQQAKADADNVKRERAEYHDRMKRLGLDDSKLPFAQYCMNGLFKLTDNAVTQWYDTHIRKLPKTYT